MERFDTVDFDNQYNWYQDDTVSLDKGLLSDQQVPDWWSAAIQRVGFLLDLPDNWDSYGANKIKPSLTYFAVQILQQIARPGIPAPAIVPTANGRLQFEWHTNGIDLEFEVLSPTEIEVSFEDANTGTEWDRRLDYNLKPLVEVLKLLAAKDTHTSRHLYLVK